MQELYHGWWGKARRMTKRQIDEMIKNMGKTKIINKKSNEYHKKEENEAENIIKKLTMDS